jgi:hypothetical protein
MKLYQGVKPNYKKYRRDLIVSSGTPALIYIDCMFQEEVVNNTLPDLGSSSVNDVPNYTNYAPTAKTRTAGVNTDFTGSLTYSDDGEGSQVLNSSYLFNSHSIAKPLFDAYTFSVWFKPNAVVNAASSNQTIVQLFYSVNNEGAWYIGLGSSTGTAGMTNEYIAIINTGLEVGGGPATNRRTGIADGGSLAANTWVNLTFRWNEAALRYDIFKDNVLYTSYITSTGINSGHIKALGTNGSIIGNDFKQANSVGLGGLIGGASGSGGDSRTFFNGKIAAFWLYNKILTNQELTYNYNSLLDRFV